MSVVCLSYFGCFVYTELKKINKIFAVNYRSMVNYGEKLKNKN